MSAPAILLIQVRDFEAARRQEVECFLRASDLAAERLTSWNLVDTPEITWEDVASFQTLILGGAGAHSATQDYAFTEPLREVVSRWMDEDRPLLGSCWGHHFLVRLLGGAVITDPGRSEVGTFTVTLTEEGQSDPLLETAPESFAAQLGHEDRVDSIPPELEELATSERCRYQIVRMKGRIVYGTQFHCELDEEGIRERLAMYPHYSSDPSKVSALSPSPWPPRLLRRFLSATKVGWTDSLGLVRMDQ